MSSVTLSGFNNIDFNSIINALMTQERVPLTKLQTQRATLKSQGDAFAALAGKLSALQSAAEDLASGGVFTGRAVTVSDSNMLQVTAGASAVPGSYEIAVNALARAQVTTTSSTYTDKDTTVVASGGTVQIGGVTVSLAGDTTLQGLADAINATADIGVSATVVQAAGRYQLVLTGKNTGLANAFAITNSLTGGSGVTFSATNAVDASDADILVNNVRVTSDSNTVEDAIPGCTISLFRKTDGVPVTATVGANADTAKEAVGSFVAAFNEMVKFVRDQTMAARKGETDNLGRDGLLRGLNGTLRQLIVAAYPNGGQIQYLSEIGVGFERTGELLFDEDMFDQAASDRPADLEKLFGNLTTGVFASFEEAIKAYTASGGLVPSAQDRIDSAMQSIDHRMADMEARLALRQEALQKEYAAVDALMTSLNSQMSSLSSLDSQYRLF